MTLCLCGCGMEVKQGKYRRGHYPRTKEILQKMSKSHEGYKWSEESKQKLSESKRGPNHWNWKGGISKQKRELSKNLCACGCGNFVYYGKKYFHGHNRKGKNNSEDHKQKISKPQKGKSRDYLKGSNNPMRRPEVKAKIIGENNHQWKGGISFLPYCSKFNFSFKERVRDFFGRVCINCGKTEQENGRRLSVHHINYDKMICCNDVKPLFVALCMSCNGEVNKNRLYWEQYFTDMINQEYNGQCYLPKENKEE